MRSFILATVIVMALPAYAVGQRERSSTGRTAVPRDEAVQPAPANQTGRRAEPRRETRAPLPARRARTSPRRRARAGRTAAERAVLKRSADVRLVSNHRLPPRGLGGRVRQECPAIDRQSRRPITVVSRITIARIGDREKGTEITDNGIDAHTAEQTSCSFHMRRR